MNDKHLLGAIHHLALQTNISSAGAQHKHSYSNPRARARTGTVHSCKEGSGLHQPAVLLQDNPSPVTSSRNFLYVLPFHFFLFVCFKLLNHAPQLTIIVKPSGINVREKCFPAVIWISSFYAIWTKV